MPRNRPYPNENRRQFRRRQRTQRRLGGRAPWMNKPLKQIDRRSRPLGQAKGLRPKQQRWVSRYLGRKARQAGVQPPTVGDKRIGPGPGQRFPRPQQPGMKERLRRRANRAERRRGNLENMPTFTTKQPKNFRESLTSKKRRQELRGYRESKRAGETPEIPSWLRRRQAAYKEQFPGRVKPKPETPEKTPTQGPVDFSGFKRLETPEGIRGAIDVALPFTNMSMADGLRGFGVGPALSGIWEVKGDLNQNPAIANDPEWRRKAVTALGTFARWVRENPEKYEKMRYNAAGEDLRPGSDKVASFLAKRT